MENMFRSIKFILSEIRQLIISPFFILLTIAGNGMILISGFLFWAIENDVNPKVVRYMDAIWWGFATATTTGYGDITPVTDAGKILSIFLMLMGLALFSIYTALFADTIISNKHLFNNRKK